MLLSFNSKIMSFKRSTFWEVNIQRGFGCHCFGELGAQNTT